MSEREWNELGSFPNGYTVFSADTDSAALYVQVVCTKSKEVMEFAWIFPPESHYYKDADDKFLVTAMEVLDFLDAVRELPARS